jgi:hypothetical protein
MGNASATGLACSSQGEGGDVPIVVRGGEDLIVESFNGSGGPALKQTLLCSNAQVLPYIHRKMWCLGWIGRDIWDWVVLSEMHYSPRKPGGARSQYGSRILRENGSAP